MKGPAPMTHVPHSALQTSRLLKWAKEQAPDEMKVGISRKRINVMEANNMSDKDYKVIVIWVFKQLSENYKQLNENYKDLNWNYTNMREKVETMIRID